MKGKLLILVLVLIGFVTSVNAFASTVDPLAIETKETPSESYLSTNRRSIAAETSIHTIAAPTRGLNRAADLNSANWSNPFLPGEDDWEIGDPGNIGYPPIPYPIGDVSFPILLSMLVIYFIYRGVSTSMKRRNNF